MIAPQSDFGEKRESPDGAMRFLFGASAVDVMPQDRTVNHNVGALSGDYRFGPGLMLKWPRAASLRAHPVPP